MKEYYLTIIVDTLAPIAFPMVEHFRTLPRLP